jgi:pimeloyl-ACP methyl ester carboxylesterase
MDTAAEHLRLLGALTPRRHESDVAGAWTAWWEYGPADGPIVLLVHGFRGDHHGLETIAARLPEHRVIAPDLPGFGVSGPLEGRAHDIDGYADWLVAFAASVGPIDVLLGHSFGSIVVAQAVARGLDPSRVVLINPIAAPALEGPRGIATRVAVLYYRVGAALPRALGEGILRSPVIVRAMSATMAKTRDPALRAWIHAEHDAYFSLFTDRERLAESFAASVGNTVTEVAERITQRTLVIAADRDDIVPLAAVHALMEKLPDAELVVLEDVGHLVHYERATDVATAIRAFLAREVPKNVHDRP